ncbi:carbamoyl-phosphate synthase large subunit [uncultured Bifidobacterium sp.]|uniref:carbamoyl-phosphate synthase large subunit n=1 Tax=uncultured Bifidobacterium sp. TaxID=165187 RepID=UPI0025863DFA|nr:carbamoyl-phosphate synthase large subunit [uncultured Bifidobacterium sp.]
MPKRTDIKSVMVIGSGPIVIGQAAEFDYSGTQACRVLREEGIRVILVNSNPATIMTDPEMADATYIEPIATPILEQIIAKERPDALLPTLGGQTALNAAMALGEAGVLKKYNVELIGASLEAIDRGEDRELFKKVVEDAGAESARSEIAHSMEEVDAIAAEMGFPIVVRPSFTMGGLGSGIAHDEEELHRIAGAGLHYSPTDEVLLEEGIEGWKEFELELMRDKNDNVVVVCPIENVDPVGVHTGDSITVAPVFTLTDREYQKLRDIGIAIIRGVGVDTGGCNIQFAVHPDTGRIIVIEMNPRVSRSSALASKATGFPIAKIATKLALGYTLDEIRNDITQSTPASFEPTIDYVVTKVPRFAFEKFPGADPSLTTSMKSVGEAMALGGNFQESLGKAMRSIDKRHMGFSWDGERPDEAEVAELLKAMKIPTEDRYLQLQRAIWGGATIEQLFEATKIDPWFLKQFMLINETALEVRDSETLNYRLLKKAKQAGLSDLQIAHLRGLGDEGENTVRELRWAFGLRPVYKTVDTCAAEFDAVTPYYYSCYADESELRQRDREAVIILGSGPNRIGQGIEFDYTCVHAVQELGKDYDTIMVNCNPETVSTDYDTSDMLFFEPLTYEDVMDVVDATDPDGVVVTLGGQTPLKLARALEEAGVPIMGTSPDAIDLAEDRDRFAALLDSLDIAYPRSAMASGLEEARSAAREIGYPLLVRPSYVLGGRGMGIVYDDAGLARYVAEATAVSPDHPVYLDKFLEGAVECDLDALCDGEDVYIGGILEHIEMAGIHSGDSACCLPPFSLSAKVQDEMASVARKIALALGVRGLVNIQFAVKDGVVYVIEANPRASRTVPFISKATGVPLAKLASRIMAGEKLAALKLPEHFAKPGRYFVKEAVMPFGRFPGADALLGPEMRSTGEVMGIAKSFPAAYMKTQMAIDYAEPEGGMAFISVNDQDKRAVAFIARELVRLGFSLLATEGTSAVLRASGVPCEVTGKIHEGKSSVVDAIAAGEISLMINTPLGMSTRDDGYELRRAAVRHGITYATTLAAAQALIAGMQAARAGELDVAPLQEL